MPHEMEVRPTVFVACSRLDEVWKDRLLTHLHVFVREGVFDVWDEDRVEPGHDRKAEMAAVLAGAKAAVLMISADFLASDFIQDEQIPRLLLQHERGGMLLV